MFTCSQHEPAVANDILNRSFQHCEICKQYSTYFIATYRSLIAPLSMSYVMCAIQQTPEADNMCVCVCVGVCVYLF